MQNHDNAFTGISKRDEIRTARSATTDGISLTNISIKNVNAKKEYAGNRIWGNVEIEKW